MTPSESSLGSAGGVAASDPFHDSITPSHHHSLGRKRKRSSYNGGSDFDDDHNDNSKSSRTDDNKKQNHSEIEKRRRDKMNTYITELSAMIPMCHAMSRKLDKLTVLRMAVQHLKSIRGTVHSYTEGHYKPAFLTDQELKVLILQEAYGFLFVVGCDRGRILYVSESVSQVLNYTQSELLGKSCFDILHPKDVAKVKEQLSSSDLNPRERLIDAKTMLPVKTDMLQGTTRLSPGARRSFYCRMKSKISQVVKEEPDTTISNKRKKQLASEKKYCVIQCTGYLKQWSTGSDGGTIANMDVGDFDGDAGSVSCLVAVGRAHPSLPTPVPVQIPSAPPLRSVQFQSRHATDGKFLFVDQRCTLILGFLPQELLGTSMYEYYHRDNMTTLADAHKATLLSSEAMKTPPYRFRTKDGGYITLQSDWKAFKNPWTKEIEYLTAKNSVVNITEKLQAKIELQPVNENYDFFNQTENTRDIPQAISTHVKSSKIGSQIAEEVWEAQRRCSNGSTPELASNEVSLSDVTCYTPHPTTIIPPISPTIIPEPLTESDLSSYSTMSNGALPHFNQVRNNVTLSSATSFGSSADDVVLEMMNSSSGGSNSHVFHQSDGNDEAAMAVIMSLLEADAGLGGPVDFSGFPWPLP